MKALIRARRRLTGREHLALARLTLAQPHDRNVLMNHTPAAHWDHGYAEAIRRSPGPEVHQSDRWTAAFLEPLRAAHAYRILVSAVASATKSAA